MLSNTLLNNDLDVPVAEQAQPSDADASPSRVGQKNMSMLFGLATVIVFFTLIDTHLEQQRKR